jgi:hypothetical protein
MGISDIHVFPITITCLLQETLCDTGTPCTFLGGKHLQCAFLTRILIEILEKCTSHLNSKFYKIQISGFGLKPLWDLFFILTRFEFLCSYKKELGNVK